MSVGGGPRERLLPDECELDHSCQRCVGKLQCTEIKTHRGATWELQKVVERKSHYFQVTLVHSGIFIILFGEHNHQLIYSLKACDS